MMKIFFTILLSFIFCLFLQTTSNAQSDTILYSAYEYPNVCRKTLQLNPNLSGSYYNQNGQSFFNDLKSTNFNQNLAITQSTFKNDEKTQGESYGSFNNYYSNNKSDDLKVTNFSSYLSIYNLQRKFSNNNRFFEWAYLVNTSYNKHRSEESPIKNLQFLSNNLGIPIKIGKGRIQPISDVFLAKFIADELVASGIISRQMTQSELFSFANEIAILENQRVFDNRRYRVYVQENLSKWLQNNFQTDKERTIELVNIITDNWLSSFVLYRESGKSFGIGLTPSFNFTRNLEEGFYQSKELAITGIIEYKNELPISQFFQRSIYVSGGIKGLEESDERNTGKYFEPFFNASYNLGYYPNSRTYMSLGANFSYQQNNSLFLNIKNNLVSSEISFSTTYFINNRVRITGNLRASYTYSNRDDVEFFGTVFQYSYNRIQLNSNVGLSYIFY